MDLMFYENETDMKTEEEENLKKNIIRIEEIIKNKEIRQNNYEEEKENCRNDYENIEYFVECNTASKKIIDEIEKLKELEESPYFGRLILNSENNENDLYIGEESIRDDENGEIVYDWRAPVASIFYSNQTSLKYNEFLYELKLKRKLLIKNKELLDCEEVYNSESEEKFINDNFLRILLKTKKNEQKFTDIIKSIQYKQNDIIRANLNSDIICQGSAGSGKTAIIVHRISYLLYNNPNISAEKFLFIAPNDNFKKELNDLNKKLQIDKITLKTLNEYYCDKINEYLNTGETQLIHLKGVNGDITEYDLLEEKDIKEIFESVKTIYIEKIKELGNLYNIKYDDNLLPLENGKKVYNHILNVLQGIEDQRRKVKPNFLSLCNLLAVNLQHADSKEYSIPQNYIQMFNERIDKKIEERKRDTQLVKDLNKNNIVNSIKEIDFKLNKYNLTKNKLELQLNIYNSIILKLTSQKKIKKLQNDLKEIENEINILNENKNFEIEKLNKLEKMEKQINEENEAKELKKYGNDIFECYNLIKDNIKKYGILDVDTRSNNVTFTMFNNYYKGLVKQLLNDEKTIASKNEIYNNFLNIANIIKVINEENDKKHEENVKKTYQDISPQGVITIVLKEALKKDLSSEILLTRGEAYLILKILSMFNFKKNSKYNYLYFDEAQDYTDLEIKLIKELEESYVNLFGDINQNIKGDWFQRKNWNYLKKYLGENVEYYELNENYRNTLNVVDYCNQNINTQMLGVGIEGKNVEIKEYCELPEIIEEAQKNNSIIITDNTEYLEQIRNTSDRRCLSVKESKGLEFQNIIVIDEGLENNSKYIAYTRTLNDLIIYRKK